MTRDEVLAAYARGDRDFHGANPRWANLRGADLTGANLTGSVLSEANLSGEDLRGADLTGANLRWANLSGADLRWANLSGANLSGANLTGANLRGADLTGANLTGSVVSEANLSGAITGAPVVPNLDQKILAAISKPGALDMDDWHTCETTHCLAGWAIHLAGKAGYELEKETTSATAGALIFGASTGSVPNFHGSNEEAIKEMEARCAKANSGTTSR